MKQQIFIDDMHDYNYEIHNDNEHILYYSEGLHWSAHVRGVNAMDVKDDGNGLIIKLGKDSNTAIGIDYAEAERLFILLKLINQPVKYEISTKQLL
jgi:hypothetical protein